MAIQVILVEDVENLGHVGQVVNVKAGFGRNYLIPQGKALAATAANLALMKARRQVYEAAAAKAREEAQAVADRIAGASVTIARKVGEAEALYGSVTASDVAEQLENLGVRVDKRRILLAEPIRKLGEFKVPVRLHADVNAQLVVTVVAEQD